MREHDYTEEIDNLVDQLANATDKLETLSKNFSKEYGSDIPTTVVDNEKKELING